MLLCSLPPDAEIQPYSLKPFLFTEFWKRISSSVGLAHLELLTSLKPKTHRTIGHLEMEGSANPTAGSTQDYPKFRLGILEMN